LFSKYFLKTISQSFLNKIQGKLGGIHPYVS